MDVRPTTANMPTAAQLREMRDTMWEGLDDFRPEAKPPGDGDSCVNSEG